MERISAVVRVRPLDQQEASKGSAWRIAGNTISLSTQPRWFDFDRVFGEESKNLDIYEAHIKDIVAAAIWGFNGTVFAYGQTSSGETHTMRGSPAEPGVIPLAVQDVFRNIKEIHVDETKGTLQFASRALRVTNCAQVNEVLTDAALLKPQKREIEELRAKLQGSHSEHLAEDILNLCNTLLQSELERERIALELQEEKKAQAECERQLKEQAQKIENLSTIVLYSAMDDREKRVKKKSRRETWCPNVPLNEFSQEVLTDAALLKRKKREIEELHAKLQGSHLEHLTEDILNLRNTLLQSDLEREHIALELQEEN